MLAGMIFVAVGTITWIYVLSKIASIEAKYNRERKGQYQINVSSARIRPQQVTSGYSGRDPKQDYELRKDAYQIYIPFAKRIICVGAGMIGLACLLNVLPRQLPRTKNK